MVYTYDQKDLTHGATIFRRENKFFDWLGEVLRPEYKEFPRDHYDPGNDAETSWFDLTAVERAWLDDVLASYSASGCGEYEVSTTETASRNPECISLEVTERFWDDDGREVTDEEQIADGQWSVASTEIEF